MVALELQEDLIEEIAELFSEKSFKTPSGEYGKLKMFKQNLPMRNVVQARGIKAAGSDEFERIDAEEDENLDESEEDEIMNDPEEDENLDEELEAMFPYCLIKLDTGKSEGSDDIHNVKTKIIFGIYDDALDASGYKDILNMIEDIRCRFRVNPSLKRKYVVQDNIEWALPDDDGDTFPFFFGALYLEWQTAEYEREDELA
ncbi:MAG: hypothetical protein ACLT3H_02770 [Roseburia sp.]